MCQYCPGVSLPAFRPCAHYGHRFDSKKLPEGLRQGKGAWMMLGDSALRHAFHVCNRLTWFLFKAGRRIPNSNSVSEGHLSVKNISSCFVTIIGDESMNELILGVNLCPICHRYCRDFITSTEEAGLDQLLSSGPWPLGEESWLDWFYRIEWEGNWSS